MQLKYLIRWPTLVLLAVLVSLSACKYLFEFRAPRESVNIEVPLVISGDELYKEITSYIQSQNFKNMPVTSDTQAAKDLHITHYSLFFSDGTGEYYKEFRFEEKAAPYVVSLQIDMNKEKTKMIYQFSEKDSKKGEKIPTVFSSEACSVITALNEYAASLVGPDHMQIRGSTSCAGGSP